MATVGGDPAGDRGRLAALVLAAGAGSRFGGRKLTAPWRDGVLVDGALGAAFAAPVGSVVVVWGADTAVQAAARRFAEANGRLDRLQLIEAHGFADGLSESLKAGINALSADCRGAFVFLGDMPRVPAGVLGPLADALAAGALAAAPTFRGRRGHPVLFSHALFSRLLALTGDRGAGELLKGLGADVALVEAPDDGVLYDVDRSEDLTETS